MRFVRNRVPYPPFRGGLANAMNRRRNAPRVAFAIFVRNKTCRVGRGGNTLYAKKRLATAINFTNGAPGNRARCAVSLNGREPCVDAMRTAATPAWRELAEVAGAMRSPKSCAARDPQYQG